MPSLDPPSRLIPAARFRALTPLYDLLCRAFGLGAALRRFELTCLDPLTFSRALDVGCGTGELLRFVAAARPTTSFVGVDADPDVLAIAGKKLEGVEPRVRLMQARAEALPFPDASFDLVISSMMLHHLDTEAKARALGEWHRVLAPGGALLLVDFGVPRRRWLKIALWPLRYSIFEEQADNLRGRVPGMLSETGFAFAEVGVYRSVIVAYTARPISG